METALLLPTMMVLMAFLLQPALVLYTRAVMGSAAAATARAAATSKTSTRGSDYVAFCKRRLASVPALDIFHVGGNDGWKIEVEGVGSSKTSVHVEGKVKPLPLLGIMVSALGKQEGDLVVVEEKVSATYAPSWVSGDYDTWIRMWK